MKLENKKIRKIIILSLVSFAISLLVYFTGILDIFELKAFDLFSRNLNPVKSSGEIVIVQVDQQSIDNLSKEGINWPWPRQIYAPIIEYLSDADAVFVDVLFSEMSSYGQQDDEIFAEAVKNASNVYLALFLTNKQRELSREDIEFIESIAIKEKITPGLSFISAVTPIDMLKASAKGAGNVTIPPDEDGVYRGVPLIFQLNDHIMPHFFLNHLIQKKIAVIRNGAIFVNGTKIPLKDNRLMLRYFKEDNPFPAIPAVNVIRSYVDISEGKKPLIEKEYFKGKKVFIGFTAAGLYDLKATSISSISTGVLIHATALDNILNKSFIKSVSRIYVVFLVLLICAFISYSVIRHVSVYVNLSILLAVFAVLLTGLAVLFKNGLYAHILYPVFSLVSSFLITAVYSYATEGKERRFVRRAFSQYMDEKIVAYVLKNPDIMKPGGQRRRVTVFFTDIAGFTSIAERLPVEETAKILHTVLNEFTEVIIKNSGVIDKYIGDAIMAFWGAPLDTEEDEINACSAAIECTKSLEKINRSFKEEGLSEIALRIGIHSGDAIAGNLGSDRLFDYTVVGDTVNLASRLESANKVFKTKIIVSEDTYFETGEKFLARDLGLIEVKGKSKPVRIFELISEKGLSDKNAEEKLALFAKAMELFNQQKWQEAKDVFGSISNDGPSEFYKKRCEYFIQNPSLTSGWDIIKITEK